MLRALKWIGLGLVALVGVFVAVVYALSGRQLDEQHQAPAGHEIALPDDSAAVARGEHLFTAAATCAECHGPEAGGLVMDQGGPFTALAAPNLTRGTGGVVADFTPADWERAIRHGIRRDGTSLVVMPSEAYTYLTDEDLGAIIAYLRQAPPVDGTIPRTGFTFLGRALVGFGKMPVLVAGKTPRVAHVAAIVPDTTAAYGRYLADIGGCRGCHGLELSGGTVPGPEGLPPASNLTPTGIGSWSQADFAAALREGRRPDGSTLNAFMPWKWYSGLTDDEVTALWAYLRSVPAKEFGGH